MSTNFPLMSTDIYNSRESIRQQMTDYLKSYMDLNQVDLTQTSFLSYIVNVLSSLTANLVFYSSSVYREFFLTQAQLSESILNLSAFLGYSSLSASYSSAEILVSIPFRFTSSEVDVTIPSGFQFYAQDIIFTTYYTTSIKIYDNSNVNINITTDNGVYNIPIIYDTTSSEESFSFILPVRQYEEITEEFQIDQDLRQYQFYNITVPVTGKIAEITVKVDNETYSSFDSLYLMSSTDKGYVYRRIDDKNLKLYFGNGLIGYQPNAGATVDVIIRQTDGLDGNVIAGSINSSDKLYTTENDTTKILDFTVTNVLPSTGGTDEENIEDVRKNAINSLQSLNRLVSKTDYENLNTIIPNTPILENTYPLLKRSDIKINEILLFFILKFGDTVFPTRNVYNTFDYNTTFVSKQTTLSIDDEDYYTLFDMNIPSTNYSLKENPITDEYLVYNSSTMTTTIQTNLHYNIGKNNLEIYLNGKHLNKNVTINGTVYGDYEEYTNTSVKFNDGVLTDGDIIRFRLGFQTVSNALYLVDLIDATNNYLNIDILTFNLNKSNEFRLYKNGILLINDSTGGDYYIDYYNNRIIFNYPTLSYSDLIKVISVSDLKITEYYKSFSGNILQLDDTFQQNNIEIYKDGLLLNKKQLLNNSLFGDYFELSNNTILMDETLNDQKLDIRIIENSAALNATSDKITYNYVASNVEITPSLIETIDKEYSITVQQIDIYTSGKNITFEVDYISSASDTTSLLCLATIIDSGKKIDLTNDYSNKKFRATLSDYTQLPENEITIEFLIYQIDNEICKYSAKVILRKVLNMSSNFEIIDDGVIVYDIPVILKSFYDSINITIFESIVLQELFKNLELENYRMLTDDANVKLANTYGYIKGMTYNDITQENVKSLLLNPIFSNLQVGDRYIVKECADDQYSSYRNNIIEWNGSSYDIYEPVTNDIVYVEDSERKVVFNRNRWYFVDTYTLPLKIKLEIFKSNNYSGTDNELISSVKTAIVDGFSDIFGLNADIHRMSIVDIVLGVEGVEYCTVVEPEIDIFFKFDVTNFTQDQLLQYAPDYIYFSETDISVKVVS